MDPSDGGRNASSDDDDSETEGEDYDNPYLALRRAKIARNQARLKELGLLSPPTKAHKKTKPKKKKIKTTTTTQPPMIVRRSKRISQHHHHQQQQEPTTLTPDDGIDDSTNNNTISNKRHRRWESSSGETVAELSSLSSSSLPASSSSSSSSSKKKKSGKTTTTQPSLPAPNSVRSINLDTNLLVMGGKKNNTIGINNSSDDVVGGVVEGSDNNNNDNNNNNNNNNNNISTTSSSILGTTMNRTGKEYVIYQSFDRAAYQDDRDRLLSSRLSFNKYSGVQEWKNVIFLWINLGSPTTTTKNKNSNNRTSSPGVVINEFLNDGKQITWVGGSRMDEDSPIVQKLIQYGRDNSNDNDNVATTSSTNTTTTNTTTTTTTTSSSSKIILWCRRYNPTTKSFLPYMCLGRLSYHSHIPDSYPVSFIWNLLDYDDMINSPNKIVKEQFQLCLDSSAAAAAAAATSLK